MKGFVRSNTPVEGSAQKTARAHSFEKIGPWFGNDLAHSTNFPLKAKLALQHNDPSPNQTKANFSKKPFWFPQVCIRSCLRFELNPHGFEFGIFFQSV